MFKYISWKHVFCMLITGIAQTYKVVLEVLKKSLYFILYVCLNFKLNMYHKNEYLPFVHPCWKLHKCFSQEQWLAHHFPNVGYSHTSLQLSPRYPGGHSLKQMFNSFHISIKNFYPSLFRPPNLVKDFRWRIKKEINNLNQSCSSKWKICI